MERLFIALNIPRNIREKIITFRNEANPDFEKYKWEAEEKIHLTLKFIGEVRKEQTKQIAEAIQFVQEYNSFNCLLTHFGFFIKNRVPKILWIGLNLDACIDELVERLNAELEKFSIASEKRKFRAHLTLRRMKGDENKDFMESFENYIVPEVKFKAGEISLMKSELLPTGSKYIEVKNYKLK